MEDKIFDSICAIIREVLQNKDLELAHSTSSKDVEGWDSLKHVMILVEVERVFSITLDFMDVIEIETLEDICRVVSKQLNP